MPHQLSLKGVKHYTPLSIGTPSQEVVVVVDTGSALLYLPEEGCEYANGVPCRPLRFNPAASGTLNDLEQQVSGCAGVWRNSGAAELWHASSIAE